MKKIVEHIYIHVPFCTTKCGYCSFYSEQFSRLKREEFVTTLLKEIDLFSKNYDLIPKSIYFGGGTPSLLTPEEIKDIINKFDYDKDTEITIEANPITLTPKYISQLSKTGVNRVSLGVQSGKTKFLKFLERKHEDVNRQLVLLREYGFKNISVDLMYGFPQQTLDDVREEIEYYNALDVEHISLYCLSIDEGCKFFEDNVILPDSDLVADMYHLICSSLLTKGFAQYEISNFTRPGYESVHNSSYWEGVDYLGLGAGAVGTINSVRYNNADYKEWKDNIDAGKIMQEVEELSDIDKSNEYIMLQMRLNRGLDIMQLKDKYKIDLLTSKRHEIDKYVNQKYIEVKGNSLCLTNKGRFVSNYIISDFLEE
jgi:oxygen-independent coproporphyrinogen-3 oxidase